MKHPVRQAALVLGGVMAGSATTAGLSLLIGKSWAAAFDSSNAAAWLQAAGGGMAVAATIYIADRSEDQTRLERIEREQQQARQKEEDDAATVAHLLRTAEVVSSPLRTLATMSDHHGMDDRRAIMMIRRKAYELQTSLAVGLAVDVSGTRDKAAIAAFTEVVLRISAAKGMADWIISSGAAVGSEAWNDAVEMFSAAERDIQTIQMPRLRKSAGYADTTPPTAPRIFAA